MSNAPTTSLENAPADIKLAVDLICLLEDNDIAPQTVLSALDIVRHDFEKKLQSQSL
ncbi:pleiotropic regulatory protein RsmS [Photobacterium toruni]|uniref:pleiotropic regulatory protein RsmS n=1 Tax=Photobacterium toruni TaxID=1935446 RepID=UPI002E17B325|nr:pleiotropic regulatory protein RsmS [Photobacterium toruni]